MKNTANTTSVDIDDSDIIDGVAIKARSNCWRATLFDPRVQAIASDPWAQATYVDIDEGDQGSRASKIRQQFKQLQCQTQQPGVTRVYPGRKRKKSEGENQKEGGDVTILQKRRRLKEKRRREVISTRFLNAHQFAYQYGSTCSHWGVRSWKERRAGNSIPTPEQSTELKKRALKGLASLLSCSEPDKKRGGERERELAFHCSSKSLYSMIWGAPMPYSKLKTPAQRDALSAERQFTTSL